MTTATAMQSELDQRWAAMRDWVWDQDAVELAHFDALLSRESPRGLLAAIAERPELLRSMRRLASLALDEALVRGLPAGDGEAP